MLKAHKKTLDLELTPSIRLDLKELKHGDCINYRSYFADQKLNI
mgnify:FL=1